MDQEQDIETGEVYGDGDTTDARVNDHELVIDDRHDNEYDEYDEEDEDD